MSGLGSLARGNDLQLIPLFQIPPAPGSLKANVQKRSYRESKKAFGYEQTRVHSKQRPFFPLQQVWPEAGHSMRSLPRQAGIRSWWPRLNSI